MPVRVSVMGFEFVGLQVSTRAEFSKAFVLLRVRVGSIGGRLNGRSFFDFDRLILFLGMVASFLLTLSKLLVARNSTKVSLLQDSFLLRSSMLI